MYLKEKKVSEILCFQKKLQNFLCPSQKRKKIFIGIRANFCSFSGNFRACYILKALSTYLKSKTSQVARYFMIKILKQK